MKPLSQSPNTRLKLSDSVQHKLDMYALAASAAGVGALALAQPAEARIVYTGAYRTIGPNDYKLDLNHGRKPDFSFRWRSYVTDSGAGSWLSIFPFTGTRNRIWGTGIRYASVLPRGAMVGPNKKHFQAGFNLIYQQGYWCCFTSTHKGLWTKGAHGYLGFKFFIDGKAHYGWARLTRENGRRATVLLIGYAYETIPNKAIIAGRTKGPDVITVQPGSLGRLALGRK